MFSGSNQLVNFFFTEIGTELNVRSKSRFGKTADWLAQYAGILKPVSQFIPPPGAAAVGEAAAAALGGLSVPSPKRPSKPLRKNSLHRVLTNPYYTDVIRCKGVHHPGAHEPIVEPALFHQVQSLLKGRNAHATRHIQHAHHLKGLLHSGTGGSRMLLDFATNPLFWHQPPDRARAHGSNHAPVTLGEVGAQTGGW